MVCDHLPMTRIALIRKVFHADPDGALLRQSLVEAKELGASIAVLPELPLNAWSPASRVPCEEDAELISGARVRKQSHAAASVGIGLVGGAIIRDDTGIRRNTALVFGPDGTLLDTYAKCHIPDEPGFRESDHYDAGASFARPVHGLELPIGIQICSDANRPQGTQVLASLGAELVVVPRATEEATWHRWKPVLQASALTCCCYVASVNRPSPENGVLIGGPSFAVDPTGKILIESEEDITVFDVDRSSMDTHRSMYPGYISVRSDLYADAWSEVRDQ